MPKALVIGQLGRPHGWRGEIKLYSHTTPYEGVVTYDPWLLYEGNDWVTIKVTSLRSVHDHYLIKIQDVDDRNAAAQLTKRAIYTWRDQLEPLAEGEHYWVDLEALSVKDDQGRPRGSVSHLFATGANDVLVIQNGKNEWLVPYTDDAVIQVDRDRGVIIIAHEMFQ